MRPLRHLTPVLPFPVIANKPVDVSGVPKPDRSTLRTTAPLRKQPFRPHAVYLFRFNTLHCPVSPVVTIGFGD
jgi:hypothetical protein